MKPRYGDRLREAMDAEGVTQDQLAERAGVKQQTISKILSGADPRWTTTQALEKALPRLRLVNDHAA